MYLHLRCHISKSCTQYFPASLVDGVWVKSASTYPGYSRSEASTERVIVTSDGLVPLSPTLQIITTALDCLRLATTQQLQKDAKKCQLAQCHKCKPQKWPNPNPTTRQYPNIPLHPTAERLGEALLRPDLQCTR